MYKNKSSLGVLIWLYFIIALVFSIIFVGGVTRLTHSGLSMVDWSPIVGVIPPLNYEEWMLKFERYKLFPEYQLINYEMSLEDFKSIFFWEYFHRILGRLVGIIFFFPWLYFVISKKLTRKLAIKTFGIFILGGLQGLMGWYMVKSGLVNNPYVSHFRLAAHFSLALILIALTFWIIWDLKFSASKKVFHNLSRTSLYYKSWGVVSLVCLQIIYGAFTAGLKAGFSYNTYPLMDGEWFPSLFFELTPAWLNFFSGSAAVQFIHRSLGLTCVLSILYLYRELRKSNFSDALNIKSRLLVFWVFMQFTLGVLTLVNGVPVFLASSHQLCAVLLMINCLAITHELYVMKIRPVLEKRIQTK